ARRHRRRGRRITFDRTRQSCSQSGKEDGMPRYYCDYCGTYLTHDSAPGRRQHNRGWKHTDNVKLHYKQFLDDFIKKQAANGGMGTGGQGMSSGGQGMGSGPGGPRTMGSGSLGRGAMNNSLMPGGGGMGVRAGGGPMMGGPMGGPMARGPMGGPPGGMGGPRGPPGGFGMGGPPGGMGAPRGPPGAPPQAPPQGQPPIQPPPNVNGNGNGPGPAASGPEGLRT
ncbi:unnamed protein product, partial [Laminaria digitata]